MFTEILELILNRGKSHVPSKTNENNEVEYELKYKIDELFNENTRATMKE
jgi:hypothetical protein